MAEEKTYTVTTACPDCGTKSEETHTPEEMAAKYGTTKTVKARCSKCRRDYENLMKQACLDWDEQCTMEMSRFG